MRREGKRTQGSKVRSHGWKGLHTIHPYIFSRQRLAAMYIPGVRYKIDCCTLQLITKSSFTHHHASPVHLQHAACSHGTERNVYMYATATVHATWQTVQPGPTQLSSAQLISAHLARSLVQISPFHHYCLSPIPPRWSFLE